MILEQEVMIEMATLGGAKSPAHGRPNQLLKRAKKADIVIVETQSNLNMMPNYDIRDTGLPSVNPKKQHRHHHC
ncbi:hypothetical protein O9929_15195 [Vibrio lentus]|nr:hypothetical protein [Vibrio lentus]